MSLNVVNKTDGSLTQVAGTAGTAASRITFDDTSSSLGSSNVQGAIDNLTTIVNTKQASTDNTLTTTAKTVVGAINEVRSGLTNVQDDVKLNTQDLTTGSRTQNIAPITLSDIKANNTEGTWADNVYTLNDVTFNVSTDSNGNVDGITVNGTASDTAVLTLYNLPSFFTVGKQYVVSGCYSGGTAETYKHDLLRSDAVLTTEYGSGVTVTANSTYVNTNVRERIVVYSGVTLDNAVFLPMVRLATASASYAPYIPSVESRIEAVESGLINVTGRIRNNITSRLLNLATAVAEQNLEKYGYAIGDYFVGTSGYKYHLADMDTFYGGYTNGKIVLDTHHISIVVDTNVTSTWGPTNFSGYKESYIRTCIEGTVLNTIKTDFIALFGGSTGLEHLLQHTLNILGKIGISDPHWEPVGLTTYISPMTEVQVCGCPIWSYDGYEQGEACTQLEIFRKFKWNEIYGRNIIVWLRCRASDTDACYITGTGRVYHDLFEGERYVSGIILFN